MSQMVIDREMLADSCLVFLREMDAIEEYEKTVVHLPFLPF